MYNYDIKAMRFIVLTTTVCFFFAMLVMNAYKYIPQNDNQKNLNLYNNESALFPPTLTSNNVEKNNAVQVDVTEEDVIETYSEDVIEENRNENEEEIKVSTSVKNLEPLEPAEELNDISNSDLLQKKEKVSENKKTEELIRKAEIFYNDGEYDEALKIYENIINTTTNKELKAVCLEKSSRISYKQRRYGNAIVFMQQSNKLVPSQNKEYFLKQIYEKIDFNPINK
ncbi:MAG: hypothetical protein E7Z89_06165 [Cyanobacteria bacterium SIG28]|nr:hypothetical protein [Cyanobacteria bacterium SIG28]